MHTQIASVEPDDKIELLDLMNQVICTSVTQDETLQTSYIENVTQNLEWWMDYPTLGCHLKAVHHQTIVGVVLVKNYWNLCSLFVAPEYHRQGIGRALMTAAIDDCRRKSDKSGIRLNAAPNAIAFYRTLGFVKRDSNQNLPAGVEAMQFVF